MDATVAIAKNDDAVEGPWALPEGWAWTKIESVLAPMDDGRIIHHGWSPQCEAFPSNNIDAWGVLKTTAVQPGVFLAHENKVLPSQLAARKNLEVHAGDLLLTCAGPRSRCGVACLVRETRPRLIFSGKMYRFRSAPNVMDARFLEAFLQTFHAWRTIDSMKTGGSDSGLNLTHDRFRQLMVPVAPLKEQRRIVARVDALFAGIAEGEAALAAARKGFNIFRRALLKAAVTGELTKDWRAVNPTIETGHDLLTRIRKDRASPTITKGRGRHSTDPSPLDTSSLPALPEGWAWERLSALGDFGRGKSRHRPRDDARLYGGSMPFVQTGVVANSDDFIRTYQQTYSEFGVAQSRVWPPGTVCITIAANIAKTAITTFACCFPDSIVGLTPVPTINPYWIHIWIKTIQQRLERFAPATAQKNINLEVLDAVMVPIPPPAEATEILRRIAEALSAAADTLAALDAEAADAARLKQAILKAAFEGRLTAQNATDESAPALLVRHAAKSPAASAGRGRTRKSAA